MKDVQIDFSIFYFFLSRGVRLALPKDGRQIMSSDIYVGSLKRFTPLSPNATPIYLTSTYIYQMLQTLYTNWL